MDIINYTKDFSDFKTGVAELRKLVPDTVNYLGDDENLTENDAIYKLASKYMTNIPIPSNPNYPYTYSFKSDSFGLIFGTDKRVRFGWKSKKDQNGDYFYIFKVIFPNARSKSTCEYDLIKNGWRDKAFSTNRNYKEKAATTTNAEE